MEKDSKLYEYGCLMVYLKIPYWNDLLSKINSDDLFKDDTDRYGLETEPHCTILYGIHSDVSDEDILSNFSNLKKSQFDIEINGVDCFYNKDYDVLKLNVKSNMLNQLNDSAKSLPYTNTYPDYKPHITIAYLKKGKGNLYVSTTFKSNLDNFIDKIVYSKPNGEKIDIILT